MLVTTHMYVINIYIYIYFTYYKDILHYKRVITKSYNRIYNCTLNLPIDTYSSTIKLVSNAIKQMSQSCLCLYFVLLINLLLLINQMASESQQIWCTVVWEITPVNEVWYSQIHVKPANFIYPTHCCFGLVEDGTIEGFP